MKTYVLPGISTAQRELLKRSGVPFSNWASGIIITGEGSRNEALAVLNATATEIETEYENFVTLYLAYRELTTEDRGINLPPHRTNDYGGFVPLIEEQYRDEPQRRVANEYGTYFGIGSLRREMDERFPGWDGTTPQEKTRRDALATRSSKVKIRQDPNDPNAASRQNYVNACAQRLEEVRENSRSLAIPTMSALVNAQRELIAAARSSEFAASANGVEADVRARFAAEIQRVRDTAKVADVRVVPNGLTVFTEKLVAVSPDGDRRDIGRFMIWIKFSGDETGVYWFNSTRRVNGFRDGMNAPYVYSDGRPSAEELLHTFVELIGRCEFAAVVDMAIQFVETINPENPLSEYLDCWPAARKIKSENATKGRKKTAATDNKPNDALWAE